MPLLPRFGEESARLTGRPPDIVFVIPGETVPGHAPAAPAIITLASLNKVMLPSMVRRVKLAPRVRLSMWPRPLSPASLALSVHVRTLRNTSDEAEHREQMSTKNAKQRGSLVCSAVD